MNSRNFAPHLLSAVLSGICLLSGGCASIFHGGNRAISISSEPSGAKAEVRKVEGDVVTVNKTPCTVSLDPKRGYFKGQAYVVKLEFPGYRTAQIELHPTLSGWYFGNILIGGLIGMVAVDPVTGSMWDIQPSSIDQKLSAAQMSTLEKRQGFVVVLASELTEAERQHMRKIN